MNPSNTRAWWFVLALFAAPLTAQKPLRAPGTPGSAGPRAASPSAVAFVGVNVVSTADDALRSDQTVIVRNGVIAKVGDAATTSVPWGAISITPAAGEELYLMPGLADLHTHESFRPNPFDQDELNNFLLYLVNGVTTILNLGDYSGHPPLFADRVRRGEIVGPTIYTAHFVRGLADGGLTSLNTTAETPEQGRQVVRQAKQLGYDMVKVYNSLSIEVFDAVVSEAQAQGMAVVGHGVREPGMEYILNHGMSMVAHAEEFVYTSFGFTVDDALVPAIADMVSQSGAYVVTTLSMYETLAEMFLATLNGEEAEDAFLAHEGVELLTSQRRNSWQTFFNNIYAGAAANIYPRLAFQQRFLEAFHEQGVPLLLGTDSPGIPGQVPGYSLLRDLELLVEAGLTPAEALHAGTANAGQFITESLPGEVPFGRVAEGYRADLLLLSANPLEDVRNLRALAGVMARGRWFSQQWLLETRASLPLP